MKLASLKSEVIRPEEILRIVDGVEQRCRSRLFKRYRGSEEWVPIDRLWPQCFSLDAFNVHDLTVSHYFENGQQSEEAVVEFLRKYCSELQRAAIRWKVQIKEYHVGIPGTPDVGVNVGWSFIPEWGCGNFHAGLALEAHSVAAADMRQRRDMFSRAVQAMNVGDVVHVDFTDDQLRMSATPPWRLRFMIAEPGGANPAAFDVCGFSSFDEALSGVRGLMRQMATAVSEVQCYAKMTAEDYSRLREQLSSVAVNWRVNAIVTMTDDARALLSNGAISGDTPPRVPVFKWIDETESRVEYSGDVVVDNGKVRLEVFTDADDPHGALQRLELVSGIRWSLAKVPASLGFAT